MVGMSLIARYCPVVMLIFWMTLCWGTVTHAGADPDEHRPVSEGHLRYDGKDVQVGQTYEAFLIRFADRDDLYLSPSRYRVAYTPNALQCRNAAEYPIVGEGIGKWWVISFEVLAVRETAIEEPVGSGNWGWQHQIDCTIKGMIPAQ